MEKSKSSSDIQSILCPNESGHIVNGNYIKKKLIMLGPDCLYAFCKKHGWLKVEFSRFGKKVNFEDVSIKISEAPGFIKDDPAPTVSVGRFEKKCRQS